MNKVLTKVVSLAFNAGLFILVVGGAANTCIRLADRMKMREMAQDWIRDRKTK